jgi:glucosylglycerate synthase
VLEPSQARDALAPQVVVGVPAEPDLLGASEAALALQSTLRQAYADQRTLAVVLTADPRGASAPGDLLPSSAGNEPPVVLAASTKPAGALPALVELAANLGAPACALLAPMPRPPGPGWVRDLLDPVLSGGFDLVAPAYARGRFDGVLVTGIVYPLTRALFGYRLRQPMGDEIAISAALGDVLLRDEAWRAGAPAAGDLWAITLAGDGRTAQVYLGPRPRPRAQPADVSTALAQVLATVFREMEQHAHRWMRVRGSQPVATFGEDRPPDDAAPPPAPGPLVSAFGLGWQDLRRLWIEVLPPQTLLALQRIPREPAEAFRMPDWLWARIVYDFAVGWRVKVMDREQLLRSLTPLYLGWVAGFVNEVAPLSPADAEARVERLCAAFEQEKPYVISRWRWPDRFSP